MCHAFLNDSRFYDFLTAVDESIADQVRANGCCCGGVLHSARYPRKPRGLRSALDPSYEWRLSFCCAQDGCRRRCTPPSVRFLGRKVYLGVIVVLISAMNQGLCPKRRHHLIDTLDLPPQTLARWRRWWRETFATSRCWRATRSGFIPSIGSTELPGELLGRLTGADLQSRLVQLMRLIAPITTGSWSGQLREGIGPQNM